MFNKIEIYNKYPQLTPFVGCNYISDQHSKLLIVAESHYVPENETRHRNTEKWYNGYDINENEPLYDYTYTRATFTGRSGKIANRLLKEVEDVFETDEPENEVAFYNFFLRPADYKKSFREICTSIDIEYSRKIFRENVSILNPDIVCFASKYVFDVVSGGSIIYGINHFYVNHPSSPWWYRKSKKMGNYTSKDLFNLKLREIRNA